ETRDAVDQRREDWRNAGVPLVRHLPSNQRFGAAEKPEGLSLAPRRRACRATTPGEYALGLGKTGAEPPREVHARRVPAHAAEGRAGAPQLASDTVEAGEMRACAAASDAGVRRALIPVVAVVVGDTDGVDDDPEVLDAAPRETLVNRTVARDRVGAEEAQLQARVGFRALTREIGVRLAAAVDGHEVGGHEPPHLLVGPRTLGEQARANVDRVILTNGRAGRLSVGEEAFLALLFVYVLSHGVLGIVERDEWSLRSARIVGRVLEVMEPGDLAVTEDLLVDEQVGAEAPASLKHIGAAAGARDGGDTTARREKGVLVL